MVASHPTRTLFKFSLHLWIFYHPSTIIFVEFHIGFWQLSMSFSSILKRLAVVSIDFQALFIHLIVFIMVIIFIKTFPELGLKDIFCFVCFDTIILEIECGYACVHNLKKEVYKTWRGKHKTWIGVHKTWKSVHKTWKNFHKISHFFIWGGKPQPKTG